MSRRNPLRNWQPDRFGTVTLLWAVGALLVIACGDGERLSSSRIAETGGRARGDIGGDTHQSGSAGRGGIGSAGASAIVAGNAGRGQANQAGSVAGSTIQFAEGGTGGVSGSVGAAGATATGTGGMAFAGATSAGSSAGGAPLGGASAGGAATAGVAGKTTGMGGAAIGGAATGGTVTGGGPSGGMTSAAGAAGTTGMLGVAGEANSFGGVPNAMGACSGHYHMESLNRGVVAIAVSGGIYVGWRMSGCEYDPSDPTAVSYNLYRDGTKIASVTDSTNFLDAEGTTGSTYTVRAVLGGVEQADSEIASPWAQNYLSIPLNVPAGGTVDRTVSGQTDAAYTYDANDASTGDLDGDGQYDIVLKWDPTNARDNSISGFTGNVIVDAYKLNGMQLWRIDLGKNIRAGAHYTQFLVYDFDGDGRAEVAMKTAPGTRDGTGQYLHTGPAAIDDDTADYRNPNGMVLSGNEYLTVFNGNTGAELSTTYFVVDRSFVYDWGDSTGNRVDRFLASVGFVNDVGAANPASGQASMLMGRGYYQRSTLSAWNWRGGELSRIWLYDTSPSTSTTTSLYGQGAHSMAVADVDLDGAQEIIYGAATIDSDGTFKCSTGLGHGDALHVGAFVPTRTGVEVFMPHESSTGPSYSLHDGATCEQLVLGPVRGGDTGRGAADDIYAGNPGAEMWASGSTLVSASAGTSVGTAPPSANFLIWWDADESRELLDAVAVTKYGVGQLLSCSACASNNGTKATPVLTADLLGDWREEVIWRTADNTALRLYTTTDVTARRIYTLMHDPQYRMQVSSEQTAYNQPPHPSFHIGNGMAAPPKPDIAVK